MCRGLVDVDERQARDCTRWCVRRDLCVDRVTRSRLRVSVGRLRTVYLGWGVKRGGVVCVCVSVSVGVCVSALSAFSTDASRFAPRSSAQP